MSPEDAGLIASYVNANRQLAFSYEVPQMGHTFQHYLNFADAFKGKQRAIRSESNRVTCRLAQARGDYP